MNEKPASMNASLDASRTAGHAALVGVGLMGEAMLRRLVERGWRVTAWDRDAPRCELARTLGADVAATPHQALDAADLVLMCVLDTGAVRDCVFGTGGLAQGDGNAGKLLVDLSTIDPEASRDMAAQAARQAGLRWVDSPVSGGPPAAANGTLTIMVGGAPEDFQAALPVLRELGANVTHMGPPGSGQTAKILNQAIVGAGFALMTEAVLLAEAAGIDAARLPQCLAGGLADSALLQKLYPRIAGRDFEPPTGYARQLHKDMEAVAAFARGNGQALPVVECTTRLYRAYIEAGHGMADSASLIRLYEAGLAARTNGCHD